MDIQMVTFPNSLGLQVKVQRRRKEGWRFDVWPPVTLGLTALLSKKNSRSWFLASKQTKTTKTPVYDLDTNQPRF